MSRLKMNKRLSTALGILAIVAANAAIIGSLTGVSYAAADNMMHDYSMGSTSMSSNY